MRSLKKKNYKALILDVDGTIIPYLENSLPSKKLSLAIGKAQEKIPVCLASARPFNALVHLVKHLQLKGPIITSGGARIIHALSEKILWEQPMDKNEVLSIGEMSIHTFKLPCFIIDNDNTIVFSDSYIPKKPLAMCIQGITPETADMAIQKLSHFPKAAFHIAPSWIPKKVDVLANHVAATKQYGILEVAKILNINTHDMIGVGDSGNDFPLLMACGLKVAMGNATKELKAIADYVAPTVEEDGVVDVIEKFVL